MYHVYIENSPDNARRNIGRFAAQAGLDHVAAALLTVCVTDAWLDGHVEMAVESLAAATGVSSARVTAALSRLSDLEFVDCIAAGAGSVLVRPTVLASDAGLAAGIGWWQRFALEYE